MSLTGTRQQSRAQAEKPAPAPAPGGLLRRAEEHGGARDEAASAVREALRAPGQPLDAPTRALVEPRLGHSFADVRVHTDERAAESARTVGARAYTVGRHVVFNSGRYAPETPAGLHLLAHELAHVVQQQGSASAEPFALSTPEHEREAGRVADALTWGRLPHAPVLRSGPALALEPDEESPQPASDEPPVVSPPVNTAQAEREREVEAVESGGKKYVLYQTEVRFDGSSSWLANNPGNMDYTEHTKNWGAYEGKGLPWGKHNFAIFPSESVGLAAVRSFLRKFQGLRDITLMMEMFAPAGDLKNDPNSYAAQVAKRLGVPTTKLVKDLTDPQIAEFALGIQQVEGWKVGTTKPRGDASLPEDIRKRT